MSSFATEIREWNTPLLGAYLLWQFTQGYESVGRGKSPEFFFHFVVYPILESPELANPINGRRKSFSSYVNAFSKEKKIDILAKLNEKVFDYRENTLQALDIGIAARLFEWKDEMTRLHALKVDDSGINAFLPEPILRLGSKAFRFGTWVAPLSVLTFSEFLGVQLT